MNFWGLPTITTLYTAKDKTEFGKDTEYTELSSQSNTIYL